MPVITFRTGRALAAVAVIAGLASTVPLAHADYRRARETFDRLPPETQASVTLNLIATGDFEGLFDFGFTQRLYKAVRRFEGREGLDADGVLGSEELRRLKTAGDDFNERLGNRYFTHPETGAKLLVPRKLFDKEQATADGMVFSRDDGMLSLSFVSFPAAKKSFGELYATLSASTAEKQVIYKRRFATHFVATGVFTGRKFYTWMAKTGDSTTGFTVSWSEAWNETGRKISTLLANSFLADPP